MFWYLCYDCAYGTEQYTLKKPVFYLEHIQETIISL